MSAFAPSALLTDLYELTMAAAYFDRGMQGEATFSLFVRGQPQRGYYVAAGLAPAITYLNDLHFEPHEMDFLRQSGRFKPSFLKYLSRLRFEGDVWALPEGTLFFPEEPIVEVTAPLIQAQVVETHLINAIGLHTLLTTKASRCVHAARGKKLIDFALRRTQGESAGMAAARAGYLVGFDATSNVLAAKKYDIPMAGTMAHAFVQAFEKESDAFVAYARSFPDTTVLLIDTYDTIEGAHTAARVAQHMKSKGHQLVGVRMDSGDIIALSHKVRTILDDAGLPEVQIFASGGLDEFRVADAVDRHAAIDAFGVGTKIGVSADLPYLDVVYKMVRYEDRDVYKRSPGKKTLAGRKQIFRYSDDDNALSRDVLGAREEERDGAWPQLESVVQKGQLCQQLSTLHQARAHFKKSYACLPDNYKALADPPVFPVRISSALQANQRESSLE